MRGPGWVESELLPLFVRELYGLLGHLLSAEEEGESPRGCPVPPGHLLGPTLVPGSLGGVSWGTGVGAGVCRCLGWGIHLMLTLAFVCSEAAVTVETAFALGAAPSRCPSPPWGPQVSVQAGWRSGWGEGWLVPTF